MQPMATKRSRRSIVIGGEFRFAVMAAAVLSLYFLWKTDRASASRIASQAGRVSHDRRQLRYCKRGPCGARVSAATCR
jgi:hypothetical protein